MRKDLVNPTYPGVNRSTTGAIGELKVAADLLIRGYEVFRAVSPATSCDLIAIKNGRLLRIEVRTATKGKNGRLLFSQQNNPEDRKKSDHYAAIVRNEVHYLPKLEE